MSHIVGFADGEVIDLDTVEGAYKYVGRCLRESGAPSDVFASLGKLITKTTKIHRAGLISSPDWGDCENCKALITMKANYCPGCGRQVER